MAEASPSEIAMFRAIIALAWADQRLSDEEQVRLVAYIENTESLSDQQSAQLIEEIGQPIRIDDVWSDITVARDRAHVLNVADAIFWEDGALCHSEKEIYERIKAAHMATLDVGEIRNDLAALRKELVADRHRFREEFVAERGRIGRMLHYFQTFIDRIV